ncbi:hypothetical protein CBL_12164 [Carabus blaptoides fortunei]
MFVKYECTLQPGDLLRGIHKENIKKIFYNVNRCSSIHSNEIIACKTKSTCRISAETHQNDIKLSKPHEVDMKRARHEVLKFGMSGFDPEKKEEAKVKLAITLGAKPPKNKYKNYKQLQADKIRSREVEKQRLDFQQLGKNQLGKSNAKGKFFKKRNKEKGSLLEGYGKASLKQITKTAGKK